MSSQQSRNKRKKTEDWRQGTIPLTAAVKKKARKLLRIAKQNALMFNYGAKMRRLSGAFGVITVRKHIQKHKPTHRKANRLYALKMIKNMNSTEAFNHYMKVMEMDGNASLLHNHRFGFYKADLIRLLERYHVGIKERWLRLRAFL